MKNSLAFTFLGLALCSSALSQSAITYQRRNGINWISAKNTLHSVGVTPFKAMSKDACKNVLKFSSANALIKSCKENNEVICTDKNKAHLASKAMRHAFKKGFNGDPKNIPSGASVDWRIGTQLGPMLNPDLLEEYASRLDIDPSESVVAVLNTTTMTLSENNELLAIFRPYEEDKLGGTSYFFSQDIPLFKGKSEAGIYFGPSKRGDEYLRLSSRILNCELQAYPEEYIAVPFNYAIDGRRPVSQSQSEEIQTASRQLAAEQMPAGSSDVQKALIYGFLLARSISAQTIDKIGMENIISKVFDTNASSLSVKYYPTTEELAKALSVVASYRQEGGYVKLVPEQGSESNGE